MALDKQDYTALEDLSPELQHEAKLLLRVAKSKWSSFQDHRLVVVEYNSRRKMNTEWVELDVQDPKFPENDEDWEQESLYTKAGVQKLVLHKHGSMTLTISEYEVNETYLQFLQNFNRNTIDYTHITTVAPKAEIEKEMAERAERTEKRKAAKVLALKVMNLIAHRVTALGYTLIDTDMDDEEYYSIVVNKLDGTKWQQVVPVIQKNSSIGYREGDCELIKIGLSCSGYTRESEEDVNLFINESAEISTILRAAREVVAQVEAEDYKGQYNPKRNYKKEHDEIRDEMDYWAGLENSVADGEDISDETDVSPDMLDAEWKKCEQKLKDLAREMNVSYESMELMEIMTVESYNKHIKEAMSNRDKGVLHISGMEVA